MSKPGPKSLTLVIPAFNEAASLPALYQRIARVLGDRLDWQMVVVSDGSTDETWTVLEDLHRRDPRVRSLHLLVNSGHMKALMAGIDHADGELVITMDADLQHPPEVLPEIVERWRAGALVVHTIRRDAREAGWLKRWTSSAYYRLFRRFTGIPIRAGMADFRGLDRRVVQVLRHYREETVPLRFLLAMLPLPSAEVIYRPAPRFAGKTKYSLVAMLRFGVESLFSFSLAPLYFGFVLSLLLLGLFILYSLYVLYVRLILGLAVEGWSSLILVILVVGAVQFLLFGILGGYVGAIHREVKRRPRYLVAATLGFEAEGAGAEVPLPPGDHVGRGAGR
jgi:dolichol-phosphate mannosyltransferase